MPLGVKYVNIAQRIEMPASFVSSLDIHLEVRLINNYTLISTRLLLFMTIRQKLNSFIVIIVIVLLFFYMHDCTMLTLSDIYRFRCNCETKQLSTEHVEFFHSQTKLQW